MRTYRIFMDHDYIEGGFEAYRFIELPETPIVGDLVGFVCPRSDEDDEGNIFDTTEQERFEVVARLWNENGGAEIMVEGYYGHPDLNLMDDASIKYHADRFGFLERDGWKIKINRFMCEQLEKLNNAKA